MKLDENLEAGVINIWVSALLNGSKTHGPYVSNNPNNSTSQLIDQKKRTMGAENMLEGMPISDDIMRFDAMINSNNFNCFELHNVTKKNSLYFIMQYMF